MAAFGPRKFQTICADPPWRYQKNNDMGIRTAEAHYPTMTTEALALLDVDALAAPDSHLYMWATNPTMLGMRPTIMGALSPPDLCRAWGFEPKSLITWVKTAASTGKPTRGGMGWYFRGATEHVIFAVKGDLPVPAELREPNVFFAEKSAHSVKPNEFYEIVERVSPGPYMEMFARKRRPGWDCWGNEVASTIEVAA